MALDRFVRFLHDGPNRDQVERVLKNFFNGTAEVEWVEDQSRFYITLPGKGQWPFYGVPPFQDVP